MLWILKQQNLPIPEKYLHLVSPENTEDQRLKMFSILKGIGYAKFQWVFAFWPKWLFDCCFLENSEKHSQNYMLFEKTIFVYTFLHVI